MTLPATILGQRIEWLRSRAGQTREELAALSGVSSKQIGRIERGENVPQKGTLEALAGGLGIDLGLILSAFDTSGPEARIQALEERVRDLAARLEAIEVGGI